MSIETKVLSANSPANIQAAAEILRAGGLIAFPTDTVYGVAAHGYLPGAIARIFSAKIRPASKAIPLLVSHPDDLDEVAQNLPAEARALAEHFWPGALTLIVPRATEVPAILTAGGATVAVRMPDHPLALAVIDATGAPVAGTSANLSGSSYPPITAADVLRELNGRIDLILDGGPCPGGIPSTVLDLTVEPPAMLRKGPIGYEEIAQVLGRGIVKSDT